MCVGAGPLWPKHYNNDGVGRVVSLASPFPLAWPRCRIARICRARPLRMHTTKQFRPPPLERGRRSKGGAVLGAPVHTRHALHDIRQQGMMQHIETPRLRDASLGSRLSCWPRPRLPLARSRFSAARALKPSSINNNRRKKRRSEVGGPSKQASQTIDLMGWHNRKLGGRRSVLVDLRLMDEMIDCGAISLNPRSTTKERAPPPVLLLLRTKARRLPVRGRRGPSYCCQHQHQGRALAASCCPTAGQEAHSSIDRTLEPSGARAARLVV